MDLTYKRVLLKLSGEQLAGRHGQGIDHEVVGWIVAEIKKATEVGAQVVVMIGGGNYVRGAQVAGHGVSRVTGDFMGMLGTLINAIALVDMFNSGGLPARVLSNIKASQVADDYTQRRALHQLGKGRVIVIGGGIGRPYLTTDTAALNLALELDCDAVIKVTKVDGVYDRDPVKFKDAQKIEKLSFQQALEDPAITVMDKAALGLAMEFNKPVIVCDFVNPDNIKNLVLGKNVGTRIG